jgi:hypothetical protein
MEQVIVLLDDNGLALGAVHMDEGNSIPMDKSGKIIQKISSKKTVKEAKEILLRRKFNYIG